MADAIDDLLELALEDHRRGEVAAAAAKYREIIARRPEHWDAAYLHGTTLLQLGKFADAIEAFERLLTSRSNVPDVHNNLGVAHQAIGNWEAAARAYQAAIKLQPDYHRAVFNLGRLMESRKLFADAEKCFRRAVELNPVDAAYSLRLAAVLEAENKWGDAEVILRKASESEPRNLDLHVNLAYALVNLERLDEAFELYQGILKERPDYPEIHNNVAFVLERQGRFDAALAAVRRVLELRPNYPEAYNNLGTIFRSMHQLDEACREFERAISLKPDFAIAEFNLGTTRLLAENYRQGWIGYRQHGRVAEIRAPGSPTTEWDGRPIPGKRLLVHADQGFGDAIQFARLLPVCKSASQAHVILRCQPALRRLFESLAGVDQLVVEGETDPLFHVHVALATLPALFAVTIETASRGVPYLAAPQNRRDDLDELLDRTQPGDVKVGLVWQGNPRQTRDVLRSCPLQKLVPLIETPGVTFFSLQTEEPGRRQIKHLPTGCTLIDIGSKLEDFAETAAVLARIDLLITVDTAIAHLAGAMGCPVWCLLAHTPDWRWHLERADSPWYPTMRLFRQPSWGDWDGVVTQVNTALRETILGRREAR